MLRAHTGRTCGARPPNEIDLTATRQSLNGAWQVQPAYADERPGGQRHRRIGAHRRGHAVTRPRLSVAGNVSRAPWAAHLRAPRAPGYGRVPASARAARRFRGAAGPGPWGLAVLHRWVRETPRGLALMMLCACIHGRRRGYSTTWGSTLWALRSTTAHSTAWRRIFPAGSRTTAQAWYCLCNARPARLALPCGSCRFFLFPERGLTRTRCPPWPPLAGHHAVGAAGSTGAALGALPETSLARPHEKLARQAELGSRFVYAPLINMSCIFVATGRRGVRCCDFSTAAHSDLK